MLIFYSPIVCLVASFQITKPFNPFSNCLSLFRVWLTVDSSMFGDICHRAVIWETLKVLKNQVFDCLRQRTCVASQSFLSSAIDNAATLCYHELAVWCVAILEYCDTGQYNTVSCKRAPQHDTQVEQNENADTTNRKKAMETPAGEGDRAPPTDPNHEAPLPTLEDLGPWAKSASKAVLRSGILTGRIKPTMKPKEVWNMDLEVHAPYKKNYSNWSKNLRSLQAAIGRDRDRMLNDVAAYGNDIGIINTIRSSQHNKIPWHRSEASCLLKQDMEEGLDKEKKPKDLYKSRPEYFDHFSLEEFRKHIYQRRYSEGKREIRNEKKKKKWKYPELHHTVELRINELDHDSGTDDNSHNNNDEVEG